MSPKFRIGIIIMDGKHYNLEEIIKYLLKIDQSDGMKRREDLMMRSWTLQELTAFRKLHINSLET